MLRQAAAMCLVLMFAESVFGAAERPWVEARSDAFTVVSDAGERRAREVVQRLEHVRALFAEHLKARVEPGRPVVIFALRDEDGLKELLPAFWQDRRRVRPLGVFIPATDKYLSALVLDRNSFGVVQHEYAHLLARLNARWLPLWLDEGLAEFYETTEVEGEDVRWGDVPLRHMQTLREKKPLALPALFALDRQSSLYNESDRVTVFYAQSAVLTHMLLLGDAARRVQIQAYLSLLSEGQGDAQAQRQAFGDLDALERDLEAYLRRREYKRFKVSVANPARDVRTRVLSPAEAEALRGEFLARTGRLGEARALLDAALARDPDLPLAHEALGIVDALRGRRASALAHFGEASRLAPSSPHALYRAGITRDPAAPPGADVARREQDLRKALTVAPGLAFARSALARVLLDRGGSHEEAVALAARAVEQEPHVVQHRVTLWQTFRAAGRGADASRSEGELLSMAQADPSVLASMAARLEEDENLTESELLLSRAREASPTDPTILWSLAQTFRRQKRPERAEAAYREALALSPSSPRLLNALAYWLADSGGQAEEALRLVDRALEQEPNNASFIDTRGWALFRLGRLEEAERALRSAVSLAGSAVQLDHLSDVLRARGRRDQAFVTYGRVIDAPDASDELRASATAKRDALQSPGSPAPEVAASPKP